MRTISEETARRAESVPLRAEGEPVGDWMLRATMETLGESLLEAVVTLRWLLP